MHNHQLQLPILLPKDALDDHLGVHLGDLIGHHGHLQLLLWDVLDPLDYIWSISMLKQLSRYLYFNVFYFLPVAHFDQNRW